MTMTGSARFRWLAVLLLAVVVSRIPLLPTCYSSDPDGWRVAHAGKAFWETGVYSVSRFPGYPVHEIIEGLAVLAGGPLLSNAATLLVSLVLIVFWYGFVEKHTSSPKLLTFLLAFTPLFWIDSASTIDYVWSLLFILLSFSAAQQKRAVLAGVWLGVAIGCRPTNAVALVPVFALLYLQSAPKKTLAIFAVTFLVSTLVVLSPMLMTYGLTGWVTQTLADTRDAHLPPVLRLESFLYRSVYGIGPLAVLALVGVLLAGRRRLITVCRDRNPLMIASCAGVISFVVLFAVFPLDKSYLLPVFPFLFLLVERVATRRAFLAVICCVVSFAFINPDAIHHVKPKGSPGFNLHDGMFMYELDARKQLMTDRAAMAKLPLKGKAVVMLTTSESFWFENKEVELDTSGQWTALGDVFSHSTLNPDVHFTSVLTLHSVHTLQADGYTVYCPDWATGLIQRWNGYDPVQEGVQTLPL